jgi:hypothetical protein
MTREKLFDDKPPSLWERTRWKIEAIWIFIRNVPSNIVTICQWIPILWNNWDWDYNYFLTIVQYKIRRMSKHIKEHGHFVNSDEVCAQMDECVEIIDRFFKADYVKEETAAHKEKWGETIYECIPCETEGHFRLDIYSAKARELELEEQERKEILAIYNLNDKRSEEDLDRLFELMRDKLQYWWD